jgi:GT2 family glycosyltransferase
LVEFLDGAEGYGACAPRLVGADGVTQRACHAFPLPRTALWFGTPLERWFPASAELERYFLRGFDHEHDADVVQPPATCLLLRREVWERLGGMDVALWLFYSDVDLCQRMAELGLRVRYLAGLVVRHAQGASTARYGAFVERWHTDRLRYLRKHHGLIGAACARLGTSWAFAGWGLQRALGRAQDPFWERVASYLRFLRA